MDHEVFLSLVDYLEALLAKCFMAPTVIGWAPLLATDLVNAVRKMEFGKFGFAGREAGCLPMAHPQYVLY